MLRPIPSVADIVVPPPKSSAHNSASRLLHIPNLVTVASIAITFPHAVMYFAFVGLSVSGPARKVVTNFDDIFVKG